MEKVTGRLLMDLRDNGNVQMQFAPNGMSGNTRPLLAKTVDDARSDLASFFEFTVAKADALVAQLQNARHVDVVISIDEEKVRTLLVRGTGG